MVTFNPVREVAKLREHLASGDKLISFLFGAGTSSAVSAADGQPLFPLVSGLTRGCQEGVALMGAEFAAAWKAIIEGLPAEKRTIEDILSFVRQMQSAVLDDDKLAGLSKTQISQLETTIRETISRLVRPAADRYPKTLPHHAVARWIQKIDRVHAVEIFTTNYDTLFERALEDCKLPTFDGFAGTYEPFFYPASLRFQSASPGSDWTRIWKVHGSVTWTSKENGNGGFSIVRGPESASGEMILPSVLKYDESRKQPYVAMLDRLRDVLDKREDGVLVTSGYSFADQHINEILFESLAHNPRLHLFALCFDDLPSSNQLIRTAKTATNVLVLGPKRAIVGGREGTWKVADADEAALRIPGLFDLEAPEPNAEVDLTSGTLRLGDFNVFCDLLDQIAAKP